MKQEIELKYQLKSRADYERLLALAHREQIPVHKLSQKNSFFDTPDFYLYQQQIIVRIREENNNFSLCVKRQQPHSTDDNLAIRDEFEISLSFQQVKLLYENGVYLNDMLAQVTFLKNKIINNLKYIGCFSNTRKVFIIKINNFNLKLELDKSEFPQQIIIYELEIECASEQEAKIIKPAVEKFLHNAQVNYGASKAKSARFFELLLIK